ncbi:MAG TPA: tRNA pseudouridine(13) synthase TruD [Thermodesulfovibrionales bacterium]|jgi:tRNA pseudouridine13 synthase|nr:tRNA pseudouridine(13) synthase TruD [Thermodesulfovibrionales bacterium]
MKIKVKSEDFIVEEIADVTLLKEGDYGLYLHEKRGWNTIDLLKRLSREFDIPFKDLSYGGKKDRHALTRQHVTIKFSKAVVRGPGHFEVRRDEYSLQFLGQANRPMGPDLIRGNRFTIVVRDLSRGEVQSALASLEGVKTMGFPNHYDDQRFGSFDRRQGFIAEKILRGHYNGALKIYLTHIRPEDRGEEKERKRFLLDAWSDWRGCLERAKSETEERSFSLLMEKPKDFIHPLQKIPREEMSLFFSAYQSFLWNELLRRVLRTRTESPLLAYPGVVGDYLFYDSLDRENLEYFQGLEIPTPASRLTMPDTLTGSLYSEVLKENGVRPPQFNNRRIRQAFFRATARKAIVLPQYLSAEIAEDEVYPGRIELVLKFILPRGSYATMLIKRLFSRYPEPTIGK